MNFQALQNLIEGNRLEAFSPFLEEQFLQQIRHGDFPRWRQMLSESPDITASSVDLGEVVRLGDNSDCDAATQQRLHESLKGYIPWRKGPFSLFGIDLDCEWRCNLKWQRLQNEISSLQGRKVLDVGCGNGYYGYRMLQAGADLVIGLEPHIAYVAQAWLLNHFAPTLPTYVLPLTLEQAPPRLQCFDTVFSMGVLYHRRSPIDHIVQLKDCLRHGGELVLETLYVDGIEGYSLTPDDKYARMSNVWFLPSIATLSQWLTRCGFVDIRVIDESVTTIEEQRKTEWMPFDSLDDSLDNANPELTIEGLPKPKRVVVRASRP
jgi:tRNA (mo5U34)-methyltransferase